MRKSAAATPIASNNVCMVNRPVKAWAGTVTAKVMGHQKGQDHLQPGWINGRRPATGLVHGLKNDQDILGLDKPKGASREDHPKAIDNGDTSQQRHHKADGLYQTKLPT